MKGAGGVNDTVENAGSSSGSGGNDDGGESNEHGENDLTGKETRKEKGAVKWPVFLKYIKAAGLHHAAGLILLYIGDTAVQALSTYWLIWWGANRFNRPASWYTLGLGGLSLVQVGLVIGRLLLRSASTIRASVLIHDGMARGLLQSPLSFFHRTPSGRITNRFGNDLEDLDGNVHWDLCELAGNIVAATRTIAVCAVANPRFLLIMPVIFFIFSRIQRFVEIGLREVARIETVIRSPLYTHFGETLKGKHWPHLICCTPLSVPIE